MHKNTLFSPSQKSSHFFSDIFSQKKIFLVFFLVFFIFSAFFSSNFTFADSKATNKADAYSPEKTYSAGDTIRISTNTSESNDSVKVEGFMQDNNGEWVSDVFTNTDKLFINTTFEKAWMDDNRTTHTVTEEITASGGTPLRLVVIEKAIGGSFGTRDIWWLTSGTNFGSFDSEKIKTLFSENFLKLNNSGYFSPIIEAKVEAVCELSGYVRGDDESSYVYLGESVEQEGVRYTCLDTGEFDTEQLTQNVDLTAISRNNPEKTTVGEVLDLDFEIGVEGCDNSDNLISKIFGNLGGNVGNFPALQNMFAGHLQAGSGTTTQNSCNASELSGKNVWFSVSWDDDEFLLVDGNERAITDFSRTGFTSGATNWTCEKTSESLETVTCSASTHTALDNGLTTTSILEKFDFIALQKTTGNTKNTKNTITFSTGIDSGEISVVDDNTANNSVTVAVAVEDPDLEIEADDIDANIADLERRSLSYLTRKISQAFGRKFYSV